MDKNNIVFNHTMEEYNKKYHNRRNRLLKYTQKEVESNSKLLEGKKWWYIKEKDTYYEVPKPPRYTWFRNLNGVIQVCTCAVLGAAVVTSIVVPTVIAVSKNNTVKAIIDPSKASEAEITGGTKNAEGTIYKISPKDTSKKKITAIESVYIGNDELEKTKEYTTEQVDESIKLTIKQVAFNNHKGDLKVKPVVEDKVDPTPVVHVESVSLNKHSLELVEGNSETLSVTVLPNNASDKSVKYSSSNTSVVTVGETTGVVKAIAQGTATITVITNDGSKTDTCNVTVEQAIHVTDVTSYSNGILNNSPDGFPASDLNIKVLPDNATNKNYTIKSDNEAICKPELVNNIWMIKKGTNPSEGDSATLTVTTEDGSKQTTMKVYYPTYSKLTLEYDSGKEVYYVKIKQNESDTVICPNNWYQDGITQHVSNIRDNSPITVSTLIYNYNTLNGQFMANTSLKKVILLDGNYQIPDSGAFENCSSLEELYIGEKVFDNWCSCFSGCTSLKKIFMDSIEAANDTTNPGYFTNAEYVYVKEGIVISEASAKLKTLYDATGATTVPGYVEYKKKTTP